ncbi:MAG: hypothetical protein IPJ13_15305 [Saprospiraceae bacterium]|nr:hypothetical protein [Saprospiraceae bacterium]
MAVSKIVSFDGLDSIVVNYLSGYGTDEIYETKAIGMPVKYGTNPSNMTTKNSEETNYIIRQKTLDQIIGTNNSLIFQYAVRQDLKAYNSTLNQPFRISSIKYNNGGNCVEYLLDHSYFNAVANTTDSYEKRLKLNSIQKDLVLIQIFQNPL